MYINYFIINLINRITIVLMMLKINFVLSQNSKFNTKVKKLFQIGYKKHSECFKLYLWKNKISNTFFTDYNDV